jgi:hypothetical protein
MWGFPPSGSSADVSCGRLLIVYLQMFDDNSRIATAKYSPNLDGGCGESIEVDCEALEVRERAVLQRTIMRSAQDHARRTPRLQRFVPARCAQTPALTGP